MYHLLSEGDRRSAAAELLRVLKPGGMVFAAFLNRLAVLRVAVDQDLPFFTSYTFDLVERWYDEGVFISPIAGIFTDTFSMHPREVPPFMEGTGFQTVDLVSSQSIAADRQKHLSQFKENQPELYPWVLERLIESANDPTTSVRDSICSTSDGSVTSRQDLRRLRPGARTRGCRAGRRLRRYGVCAVSAPGDARTGEADRGQSRQGRRATPTSTDANGVEAALGGRRPLVVGVFADQDADTINAICDDVRPRPRAALRLGALGGLRAHPPPDLQVHEGPRRRDRARPDGARPRGRDRAPRPLCRGDLRRNGQDARLECRLRNREADARRCSPAA